MEIKVITQRQVIQDVLNSWRRQYADYSRELLIGRPGNQRAIGIIESHIAALNLDTCSVEDVDVAIGVSGWASNECDMCGSKNNERIVRIGEATDSYMRGVDLCPECLKRAYSILEQE